MAWDAIKILVWYVEIVITGKNQRQEEQLFFIVSSRFCFDDSDSEIPYRAYSLIPGTLFAHILPYYLKETLLEIYKFIIMKINTHF